MRIGFGWDGDGAERKLEDFRLHLDDMTDPLQKAGDLVVTTIVEQFATEGARGGHPWAPLRDAYQAWKLKHFPGEPLLRARGELYGNAVAPEPAGREEWEKLITVPYAHFLHGGFKPGGWAEGSPAVPARPIVDLTEADKREIVDKFQVWLKEIS